RAVRAPSRPFERRRRRSELDHVVAGADVAFGNDPRDPAAVAHDQLGQVRVPLLQAATRDADVGDLDRAAAGGFPDAQAVALGELLEVEAGDREVFADG